jgi:hypothetical protein
MTSKEYIIWLKGFIEACHEYAPTPKQWDALKDKLAEVDDSIPLGGIISDHNTFKVHEPYPMWQQPHTINPYYIGDIPQVNLPFISTTPNGTGGNPTPPAFTISTTPGSGSISVGSGFGGLTTSTTRWNPSGSAWSYTNAGYNPPYTTGEGLDNNKKPHNED